MSAAIDKWVASRATKEQAKDRLADLPTSSTRHGLAVPFDVGNKRDYKSKHTNHEINTAIEKAPIKDVPLDKLIAIQRSVKAKRVEQYIDDPDLVPKGTRHAKHGGLVDLPIVIKQDGKLFCHDGHHRAASAKLLGERTIRARFVDFDTRK